MFCFRVLTDYLHLLEDWKVRYAIRQAIRNWNRQATSSVPENGTRKGGCAVQTM